MNNFPEFPSSLYKMQWENLQRAKSARDYSLSFSCSASLPPPLSRGLCCVRCFCFCFDIERVHSHLLHAHNCSAPLTDTRTKNYTKHKQQLPKQNEKEKKTRGTVGSKKEIK